MYTKFEMYGFVKKHEISCLGERMLVSPEGLCFS